MNYAGAVAAPLCGDTASNAPAPKKEIMEITPAHKWTNKGSEVLILRCCDKDGRSYNGFQWPLEVGKPVAAPDANDKPERGGGLHGWPWGIAIGDGKDPDWVDGIWIVFGADPKKTIDLGGKCKVPHAIVRFVGTWDKALEFILPGQMSWGRQASEGASCATGDNSASCAVGNSSCAIATGPNSRARAGRYGVIALAWWNKYTTRTEMRCAEIGCGDGSDGKLKADTWYELDESGKFIEVMK